MVEARYTGVFTAPKCSALMRPAWTARVSFFRSFSSATMTEQSLRWPRFHVRFGLRLRSKRLVAPLLEHIAQRPVEQPRHGARCRADTGAQQEELHLVHLAEETADIAFQQIAGEAGDEPQSHHHRKDGC